MLYDSLLQRTESHQNRRGRKENGGFQGLGGKTESYCFMDREFQIYKIEGVNGDQ